MEQYAQILNYAIPFFLVLIAIEYAASCFMDFKVNRLFDTISSLSSGLTNVIKDVLGLSIVIVSYDWFVSHFALIEIQTTWLLYVMAFIGIDFACTRKQTDILLCVWRIRLRYDLADSLKII